MPSAEFGYFKWTLQRDISWHQTKIIMIRHHWCDLFKLSIFAAQFCLFFIFSLKRVVGAEHCTDTTADTRPRVCQLAVCTSCGRVTKRWPEISLRLHPVLDSEKEVDLPTEPSHTVNGRPRLFDRRTRSDEIRPRTHTVDLLESPSQPASQPSDVPEGRPTQIRARPLPFKIHYLPTRTPYLPEFFGLCLSFWKWEKAGERDQSSRAFAAQCLSEL